MRTARRIPATVATALLWLVVLAPPVAAHAADGENHTNFASRLHAVTPEVPGLDVEVIENGDRMQLTNRTDREVVVLGYQGEPYLRVGPGGIEENLNSPATYLNQDRQGNTAVPGRADAEAEPEWSDAGSGVARWHDHRVHWMGGDDPPAVQEDPDQRHTVIPEWVVPLRVGDTDVEVTGDLVWVPGPSPVPWLVGAAVLLVGVVLASRLAAWRPVLAGVAGVLVLADVVHALGVGLSVADTLGNQLAQIAAGSFVSIIGWIAGVTGAVLLLRRNETGVVAVALAGILIAFNGGIADLAGLSRSQMLFAWSDGLARATTAVALGGGLGLLAGAGLRLSRAGAEPETGSGAGDEAPAPAGS